MKFDKKNFGCVRGAQRCNNIVISRMYQSRWNNLVTTNLSLPPVLEQAARRQRGISL